MAKPDHILNDHALIQLLQQSGWLPAVVPVMRTVIDAAVLAYQEFHRFDAQGREVLQPDGTVGPVTAEHMQQPRFCGHPDRMSLEAKGRWNPSIAKTLKWGVKSTPKSITLADFKQHIQAAFDAWSEVCGIKASYTKSMAEVHFVIGAGKIDGPGGTLAWSYLPSGMSYTSPPLEQLYDDAERFGTDIKLGNVLAHELGHALGLPHLASGCLMQPMYSHDLTGPQAGDITEVVALYGKPESDAPPAPPIVPLMKEIKIRGYGLEVVNG